MTIGLIVPDTPEFRSMRNVRLNKGELLQLLEKNREAHRAEFDKAIEGYKRYVLEALETQVLRVKDGKLPELTFGFPIPEDHTGDYDRVISMLTMSLDDELVLSEEEYRQYAMDDWGWMKQFKTASANYIGEHGTL